MNIKRVVSSRKEYSFDESCHYLAQSFLDDAKPPRGMAPGDATKNVNDLAQEIQELIEAFMRERGYQ